MAIRSASGTANGSTTKHTDVGSNTLVAGTHFMFMWDDTQLTSLSMARQRLNDLYQILASNKAFGP